MWKLENENNVKMCICVSTFEQLEKTVVKPGTMFNIVGTVH